MQTQQARVAGNKNMSENRPLFGGIAGIHVFVHENYIIIPENIMKENPTYVKRCYLPDETLMTLSDKYSTMDFKRAVEEASTDDEMVKTFRERCFTIDLFGDRSNGLDYNDQQGLIMNQLGNLGKAINFVKRNKLNYDFYAKNDMMAPLVALEDNSLNGYPSKWTFKRNVYYMCLSLQVEINDTLKTVFRNLVEEDVDLVNILVARYPHLLESVLPSVGFNTLKILQVEAIGTDDAYAVQNGGKFTRWESFVAKIMRYRENNGNINAPTSVQICPIKDPKTILPNDQRRVPSEFKKILQHFDISKADFNVNASDSAGVLRYSNKNAFFAALSSVTVINIKLHEAMFVSSKKTRLPFNFWSDATPLFQHDMVRLENTANRGSQIGKGFFGVVYGAQWIFSNACHGHLIDDREQKIMHNLSMLNGASSLDVKNGAILHSLDEIDKMLESCSVMTDITGSENVYNEHKLALLFRSKQILSLELVFPKVLKKIMYNRNNNLIVDNLEEYQSVIYNTNNGILDMRVRIPLSPSSMLYNNLSLNKWANIIHPLVKIFIDQLTQVHTVKEYGKRDNSVRLSFNANMRVALIEYMRSLAILPEFSSINKLLFVAIAMSVKELSVDLNMQVVLNVEVEAVVKNSKNIAEGLRECGVVQYLSSYHMSPVAVDEIYGEKTSPFSYLSRNDINKQLLNSMFSVSPEDRSFNPIGVIQSSVIPNDVLMLEPGLSHEASLSNERIHLEIVIVDDNRTVIDFIEFLPLHANRDKYLVSLFDTFVSNCNRDTRSNLPVVYLTQTQTKNIMPAFNISCNVGSNFEDKPCITSIIMPKAKKGDLYNVLSSTKHESNASISHNNYGERKRTYSADRTLSLKQIMKCLIDILKGLCFVNMLGQSQSDVKPPNTLVSGDGTAYLSDFGVSATYGSPTRGGTPIYIPNNVPFACCMFVDAYYDAVAFGKSFLEVLFSNGTSVGEEHFVIDKSLISTFGSWMTLNIYDKMVFEYKQKASVNNHTDNNTSPTFITGPKVIASRSMSVNQENIMKIAISMEQQKSNINFCNAASEFDMPVSQELSLYVVRCLLYSLKMLSSLAPDFAHDIPLFYTKFQQSDNTSYDKTSNEWIDDHGLFLAYSEQWKSMSDENKRRYGFINCLKTTQTFYETLVRMMEMEQGQTFAKYYGST